ncbi:hypothetical protein D3C75_1254560 [compost metagenome]
MQISGHTLPFIGQRQFLYFLMGILQIMQKALNALTLMHLPKEQNRKSKHNNQH